MSINIYMNIHFLLKLLFGSLILWTIPTKLRMSMIFKVFEVEMSVMFRTTFLVSIFFPTMISLQGLI